MKVCPVPRSVRLASNSSQRSSCSADIEGLTRDCAELFDSWEAKSSRNVTRTRPPERSESRFGIADAHRGDGKRFVVRADASLTAFLELESVIRVCGELL